ncbi:response regulator transcription factor [Lutibacter sp. TH_r2]|uniref:response regulator transcription factor n=1 Tax=Lutibacter sp. TH_r2 TaxID=3082083 RepID=UPI00295380D9|nr:response regulator transcription factor [Lutibacter sp. TH_r2]MDV7186564.1 response regulator transcription factor [Lutibacter sp. TH_r2]
MSNSPINICIVDDHQLFLSSLKGLVSCFSSFKVLEGFSDGDEIVQYLEAKNPVPDIVLLDVKMKRMGGIETCTWLKNNYPSIKVLALSMEEDEENVLGMLRAGAKGYLLKDIHPEILEHAINEVYKNGFYYTDEVAKTLINNNSDSSKSGITLKERELEFLKLCCSERTYKEIASEMCLSPKTIENYREALFQKINAKSRIGLVLFAIKNKIVIL